MTRVHPQFIGSGMSKAAEAQNFEEFEKEVGKGMEYWTNLLANEIGPVDANEAPLVMAALKDLSEVYGKAVPGSEKNAEFLRGLTKKQVFVVKVPKNK